MYPPLFQLTALLVLSTLANPIAAEAQPPSGATGNRTAGAGENSHLPTAGGEENNSAGGSGTDDHPATLPPDGLQRLEELTLLSEALIAKAASGAAAAHEFRIEARMYRELLRQTMRSDRERAAEQRLPQQLLLDMVRMSALLHSAADCKTGFVITCPPDLMLQLKSQQSRISQGVTMTRMMVQ